ncbi:hypothetical protein IST455A_05807 [Burkholderia multivorans]|nr:hypothetical protein IST455A_05807 [Burkholderia multivorans]CAB5313406.1 hypothetical protein IST453_05828 [Burkholderia multivorans]CAB5314838.1 hypothetical protein IST455B_05807 [Burkholderia multivorans]
MTESWATVCAIRGGLPATLRTYGSTNHAAGPALNVANSKKSMVIKSIGTP